MWERAVEEGGDKDLNNTNVATSMGTTSRTTTEG